MTKKELQQTTVKKDFINPTTSQGKIDVPSGFAFSFNGWIRIISAYPLK